MTDFDADLIAARNAMLDRELPDMHWANDFNDNIGVTRVRELPEKTEIWTRQQGMKEAIVDQDGCIVMHDEYGLLDDDIINRICNLPELERQLAEAQAREAVAYEVAADALAVLEEDGVDFAPSYSNEIAAIRALTPTHTTAALERMMAEARNAALDEAIEAITFEAEGRKKQMDAHEHDAVQHERFRIGELQSRLNVKNVAALKTEPTP